VALDLDDLQGQGKEQKMRNGFTLTERLYKTADDEIVREGHPDAAFVYRGPGRKIPMEQAIELGLISKKEASSKAKEEPAKEDGDTVTVPDGVVPGETPGWPVAPDSGELLELTDEQREALEERGISGTIAAEDVDGVIAAAGQTTESTPESTDAQAKEAEKPAPKKEGKKKAKKAASKKGSRKRKAKGGGK
jgi:hypothetical protein